MILHSFKRHDGIRLLESPAELLKPIPLGNVVAHNFVRNERRRAALDVHVSDYFWHRRLMSGFMVKTLVAEVRKPGFKRSVMASGNKVLLNGSAGDRARNLIRRSLEYSQESIDFFKAYYSEPLLPPSAHAEKFDTDTCWIEVKNFYNFFHFLTESFHKAFSDRKAIKAADKTVFKSGSKRVEGFVKRWIDDFREIIGSNVVIEAGSTGADSAPSNIITPLSAKHLLYQFEGPHREMINAVRPPGHSWTGYDATPHPVKILALNSVDDSMFEFRDAAIALAKQRVERKWGRKIYVARSKAIARQRVMKGEDNLIAALQAKGFEVVYFEDLSPLEQIRCVNGARCIVLQHGAGMANMMFASSNTHVFELGTYQTAMSRWGDFIPIAHVAKCHYHHIFLDMDYEDEDTDPVFADHGLVAPVVSGEDVERVMSLILTHVRDKSDGVVGGLKTHAQALTGRQAYRQAYRLLDSYRQFVEDRAEYWEERAILDELCGHRRSACNNFVKAWRISGSEAAKAAFIRLADREDYERHPDLR